MKKLSFLSVILFLIVACNSEEVTLINAENLDSNSEKYLDQEMLDSDILLNDEDESSVWENMQSTSVLGLMDSSNSIELYRFYENKSIDIVETTEIGDIPVYDVALVDEERTVFKYTFFYKDDPEITDDEYAANIYFQIDKNIERFTIEGEEELKKAKAVIKQVCFCPLEYANPLYLENLTISGQKLEDGSWNVVLNCETNDYKIVTIEEVFKYAKLDDSRKLVEDK